MGGTGLGYGPAMVRVLPFALDLALLVFCLIDCIQSEPAAVRNLAKGWWIVLILFFPVVGGIAWLVAGRPTTSGPRRVPWPATATAGFPEYERPRQVAPDDDPAFLAGLTASNAEHEKLLRAWEDQLRERERRLTERDDDDRGTPPPAEH